MQHGRMSRRCNGVRRRALSQAVAVAPAMCRVESGRSREAGQERVLDRWDPSAAITEGAIPPCRIGQPSQQLGSQLVCLDDRVKNEIRGKTLEVDVLLVLAAFVLHELLALGRVRDLRDLVCVNGI